MAPALPKPAPVTSLAAFQDFPEFSQQLSEYFCSSLNTSRTHMVLLLVMDLGGHYIPAIVDSGSTSSYVGQSLIPLLKAMGNPMREVAPTHTTIANGDKITCTQEVELTVRLEDRVRNIAARVFPSMPVPLLLGLDALCTFGIVVDHFKRIWHFSGEPEHPYHFISQESPGHLNILLALTDLERSEEEKLSEFLNREIPKLRAAPGVTDLIVHHIDVGNSAPIKQRYYPVTPIIREAMNAEVDRMLEAGVIEPSTSEWSTPIVMVRKPNATYRFCLDFRKVNGVSKKDAYPLPYMNQILDRLRAAKYISPSI